MKEIRYRESRLCRVLGNPVAYNLILHLVELGPKTPSELASFLQRSVYTISHTLGKLRLADLVRFDRSGRNARYHIKYPRETMALLKALGNFEMAKQEGEIKTFRRDSAEDSPEQH